MPPRTVTAASRIAQRFSLLSLALLLGVTICACSAKPKPQEVRHPLNGTITSVEAREGFIVVDGQAVPGFMDAMKMPYQVRNPSDLARLAPGDQISADIVVSDQGDFLDHIVITKPHDQSAAPTH
ncbi:MAG: copper-binding protein [Candidatus Acidiferrales bacterium]